MAKPEVKKEEKVSPEQEQEKSKYNQDELLAIFDAIMFEGEYREDVTIKGKLKVTFKTKSGSDTAAITRELDSRKFNLMSSMQEFRALLSICYSITRYNDKDLSTASLENRIAFIEKLPSVVVAALSNALIEFDLKTEAALLEQDAF
jgi:hypothetical protein